MRVLLLTLIMLLPATAFGYKRYYCMGVVMKQPITTTVFQAGANSFPSGSNRRIALNAARDRWNEAPSNAIIDNIQWNANVDYKNGQNEIWYTNSESKLSGASAIALVDCQCYWWGHVHTKIKEVDILLDNDDTSWGNMTGKDNKVAYGGSRFSSRDVFIQEMGHAIGLGHTNTTFNIMGSDQTHLFANGNTVRSYVGEDAGNGAVALYGTTSSTNSEDVAVTHWKYRETSGEHGFHERTGIYTTSQVPVQYERWTLGSEPIYRVSAGSTVNAEFTFENNGKNTQSPRIRFYISDNSTISTSDTPIPSADRQPTLGRGKVYTRLYPVTIPCDLALWSRSYLGVIIDRDNAISEKVESNNATYIRLQIVSKEPPCLNKPDEPSQLIPTAYRLHPNTPNPFNPATTITYDLPEESRVDLRVYDVAGRLVRVLEDGAQRGAGQHQMVWQGLDEAGRRVSSGIYICKLRAGDFRDVRKMVLVQ